MDAFENIAKLYFEEKNFWVRQSVKMEVSKEDKRSIGNTSMPRPEIDLIVFDAVKNKLWLIEAKSYLDSNGVNYSGILNDNKKIKNRYRLLNDKGFQKIVVRGLKKQMIQDGLINKDTIIGFGLIAAKVRKSDEEKIKEFARKQKWLFVSPKEIKEVLQGLAEKKWDNNEVVIASKIILRN